MQKGGAKLPKATPMPSTSQSQARSMGGILLCSSCVPLVLLLCCSCSPLVLPPALRRPRGDSTALLPVFDSAGLSVIQKKSHIAMNPSDHRLVTTDHCSLSSAFCRLPSAFSPASEPRRLKGRASGSLPGGGRFPGRSPSRCPGPNTGSNWFASTGGGIARCGTGHRSAPPPA